MNEVDGARSNAAVTTSSIVFTWIRRQWGLTVAIVVPLVTVLTLVVPLVADASARTTGVDTLAIGAGADPSADRQVTDAQSSVTTALDSEVLIGESVDEQFPNTYWRVQASAPWETFPLDTSADWFCTPEQIAWLELWGRRAVADVWNGYLSLTNTATDGSALSLRNIHSVGTFTEPSVVEVAVECATGIGGYSEMIPLRQALGADTPAVFGDVYRTFAKGSPATLNIAPGEFLQVVISFSQDPARTSDFAGSLVGDVVVGDETTEVVLFDGFTRRGVPGISTTRLTIAGHTVTCGPDGQMSCTVPEFISQLKSDPGYRG